MTVDLKVLTQHIDQLSSLFINFKNTLLNEAEVLKTNQIEELPAVLEKKAQLSTQVEIEHQALSTLLNTEQQPLDELLNSNLFKTFPTNLQKQLQQIIEMVNECHDLNLSNGMTVQILNHFNQTALNILTGQEVTPSMYESSGSKNYSKNKNSLGKA